MKSTLSHLVSGLLVCGRLTWAQPADPTLSLLGSWPGVPRGSIGAFELIGDHALVAGGGLYVLDLADPAAPTALFPLQTLGWPSSIQIAGQYAYLHIPGLGGRWGWTGVQVFDVSKPNNPDALTDLPGYEFKLVAHVQSNYVYWVGRSPSDPDLVPALRVFELVDKSLTNSVGSYDTDGDFEDLIVAGQYAYGAVARQQETGPVAELQILDVSQPTEPTQIGHLELNGEALRLKVAGTLAWLVTLESSGSSGCARLHAIDVGEPIKPRLLGSYATDTFQSQSALLGFEVAGQAAFLCFAGDSGSPERLEILDLTDPRTPRLVHTLEGIAGEVRVVHHYLYVSARGGLQVFDIADPRLPLRVWRFDPAGQALSVQAVGSLAYIADGGAGLKIIDISEPARAVQIGVWTEPAEKVQVRGNYAYVVANGLHVVDVTSPAEPSCVGSALVGAYVADFQVVGNFVHLARGTDGLTIVDVSDPTRPTLLSTSPLRTDNSYWAGRQAYRAVCVVDDVVYVATTALGMDLVDVHDPTRPINLGNLQPAAWWRPVQLKKYGHYVYMATVTWPEGAEGTNHFEVFDVSVPRTPIRVGRVGTSATAEAMEVVGGLALVTTQEGLDVYDLENPASPVLVKQFDVQGRSLQAAGRRLYVADSDLRIYELDGVMLAQSIEAVQISDRLPSSAPFTISASADSGLPISFRIVSGPATINGAEVFLTGVGEVRILAEQAGNDTYNPASEELAFEVSDRLFIPELEAENGHIHLGPRPPPYAQGRVITATAVPEPDFWFMAWSGDVLERRSPATVTIDGPKKLRAHFGTMRPIGQFQGNGQTEDIAIVGDYAYIPNDWGFDTQWTGLRIINVSNPVEPAEISSFSSSSRARELCVRGDYAYLLKAYPEYDLDILDIREPARPVLVSTARVRSRCEGGMEVSAGYAYLPSSADATLCIWDLRDALNPTEVGQYRIKPLSPWDLEARGNHLYVVGDHILASFDISDPRTPLPRGTVAFDGRPYCVRVGGDCAYVGSQPTGLQTVDLSDPELPLLKQSLLPVRGDSVRQIELTEQYAFLATGENGGISVFDIPRSSAPDHVADFHIPGWTMGLQVVGNRLYAVGLDPGANGWWLRIFGVGQPQTIDVSAIPRRAITGSSHLLSAISSSRLPVSFRLLSGPARLDGSWLTLTGTGRVYLQAEQSGDDIIAPAFVPFSIDVLVEDPVRAWMASHYPDLPPEQREGTADPDGDGVPNALECLMGTDPLTDQVADGHLPLGGCIEEGGQKFFVLEFSVEEGLAVQLAWGLEQSTTLQPESWVVVPEGRVQQTGDLVTVKLPLFETARRFFRLTVHTP